MPSPAETVQLLSPDGTRVKGAGADEYGSFVDELDDDTLQAFYRRMAVTRAFDIEAANLQRQGQLALWVPSLGQEGAQVGSAFATRPQDHIFPAYREHVDRPASAASTRSTSSGCGAGNTTAAGIPPTHGNFHLYTLVHRLAGAARHGLRDGRRSSTATPARAIRRPTRPSSSTSATAR